MSFPTYSQRQRFGWRCIAGGVPLIVIGFWSLVMLHRSWLNSLPYFGLLLVGLGLFVRGKKPSTSDQWHDDDGNGESAECWACGYDLAGLRSGKCPECGQDIRETAGSTTIAAPPHDNPPPTN